MPHPSKALATIVLTDSGMERNFKLVQTLNECLLIFDTVSGIKTWVREVQPENNSSFKVV